VQLLYDLRAITSKFAYSRCEEVGGAEAVQWLAEEAEEDQRQTAEGDADVIAHAADNSWQSRCEWRRDDVRWHDDFFFFLHRFV
jgi:hypothetical protein